MWKKFDVSDKGEMILDGVNVCDLARKYGTPLIIIEENEVRKVCRSYMDRIHAKYPNGKIAYASKAFMTTAICKIVESEGLYLDVVSEGELLTAKNAGFDMKKVYYHGNAKTDEEIYRAVSLGVGCIVIDGDQEIPVIEKAAEKYGITQRVGVRLKPGIDAHTHKYILTGNEDSKFGFGINDGTADSVISLIAGAENISLEAVHCHIGSQIFDTKCFMEAVDIMTDYIKILQDRGIHINEINFGGGFGIHYTDSDTPLSYESYVSVIADTLNECISRKGLGELSFTLEPGRSIIGEAGTTIYKTISIKDIPGIRKYVSIDGGMTDNPRTALYQAEFSAVNASRADMKPDTVASIAGRCCESGDMIIWDAELKEPKVGDYIAVFSTGAYTYSMSSNYNKVPQPAVVLINKGKDSLIVKRQTFDQLIENDVIPDWI